MSLRPEQIKWFDHWLKGADAAREPEHPVRIFVMGINQWRDEDEWPLARARNEKFYLATRTVELGSKPDQSQSTPDTFVYDPRNPVPTTGGAVCCNPKVFPWGPMDQRRVEKRRDVLVYSTAPLRLRYRGDRAGQGGALCVVERARYGFHSQAGGRFPRRHARNLTDGILRMRYRESLETPKLMTPGEVYRMTIDAGVTSNVFRAGHRIRVEISSSNFPRFDRNPNTGCARRGRRRKCGKRPRRCTMIMTGIRTCCCRSSPPRPRN